MIWLVIYLIMNIMGLIIMGIDKKRAIKQQYRIRERTLWLVALFGGAVGTTIGMKLFHHKTRHLSFKIGFPLLAILDLILMMFFV
ncbi:DUF1294 domain-containing protein [Neobacillus niacini]|uniref:DUF1294 domain-containing protein n=1 Tax=Neobacillus niacini TaxID=86668 RepID=UPI00285E8C97|nr:DUF1294 domain-containing protein [Neobacillus niacini]MDR7000905.1 uncharacterized membrane protein YsdA (DUF1294 family) [Neobacillus niacini]